MSEQVLPIRVSIDNNILDKLALPEHAAALAALVCAVVAGRVVVFVPFELLLELFAISDTAAAYKLPLLAAVLLTLRPRVIERYDAIIKSELEGATIFELDEASQGKALKTLKLASEGKLPPAALKSAREGLNAFA